MASTSEKQKFIVRVDPVHLDFSLYDHEVNSSNYEKVLTEVLAPIHAIFCEQSLYLITSRHGESLCSSGGVHLNTTLSDFGEPTETVLRTLPVTVTDVHHEQVHWTSWKAGFQVLQLGEAITHDELGFSNHTMSKSPIVLDDSFGISSLLQKRVQDALSIVLDTEAQSPDNVIPGRVAFDIMQKVLPSARLSLLGEEILSWPDLFPPKVVEREKSKSQLHQTESAKRHHLVAYPDAGHAQRLQAQKHKATTRFHLDSPLCFLFFGVVLTLWAFRPSRPRKGTEQHEYPVGDLEERLLTESQVSFELISR